MDEEQWERPWLYYHLAGLLDKNEDEILYKNQHECFPTIHGSIYRKLSVELLV